MLQLIVALRGLAAVYELTSNLEEMLWDHLVENVASHHKQEWLLLKPVLRSHRAITIAGFEYLHQIFWCHCCKPLPKPLSAKPHSAAFTWPAFTSTCYQCRSNRHLTYNPILQVGGSKPSNKTVIMQECIFQHIQLFCSVQKSWLT